MVEDETLVGPLENIVKPKEEEEGPGCYDYEYT